MQLDDLIAEGESLIRPCFLLTVSPSARLGGFWGGERRDKPNALPPAATALRSLRHIVTIDRTLLAELGLPSTAPLSLFEAKHVDGNESHRIERAPLPHFDEISCTGQPLYAVRGESFPPIDAVCLYGSARVAEWLSGVDLARHRYFDTYHLPIVKQYMDEFACRAPLYSGKADVIVGGWHMTWPEDDFFIPLEMRLVLTTIRDAEPYFEVWVTDGAVNNYRVKSRIAG
jgi:hypothetical protein